MIVDDSTVARAVLSRMLDSDPDFDVVAFASTADAALETLKTVRVDIVLLDVEMPGTSGLEALPEILQRGGGARVLIVSSLAEAGAEVTVRALALGAADTLPKPGGSFFGGRFAEVLADRIRRIGRAARDHDLQPGEHDAGPIRLCEMPEDTLACLALGASTGGLHALISFLDALPRIDVPILITQHLPPVFMPYFARQLEAASGHRVRVAEDGVLLEKGIAMVAPGDAHLTIERRAEEVRVRLDRRRAASGCCPSVDPMLAAAATVYGAGALGVMLSGMGRDGLAGAEALVAAGGAMLVQDKFTSAVWGMPRCVAEAGLASAVAPPAELARCVAARVDASSWS